MSYLAPNDSFWFPASKPIGLNFCQVTSLLNSSRLPTLSSVYNFSSDLRFYFPCAQSGRRNPWRRYLNLRANPNKPTKSNLRNRRSSDGDLCSNGLRDSSGRRSCGDGMWISDQQSAPGSLLTNGFAAGIRKELRNSLGITESPKLGSP